MPGFTIARLLPPTRVAGVLALLLSAPLAARAGSFAPSETIFPETTRAWLSVPDPEAFRERFERSSYGQLVADPAMKAFMDSIREQIATNGRRRLEKLGLTLDDLEKIPGGELEIGRAHV